jgi:hypothetical protein
MFRGAIGSAKTWPSNFSPASGRATRPATLTSLKVTRWPEAAETVASAERARASLSSSDFVNPSIRRASSVTGSRRSEPSAGSCEYEYENSHCGHGRARAGRYIGPPPKGFGGQGVGGGHLCECEWGTGTGFQAGLGGAPDFRT